MMPGTKCALLVGWGLLVTMHCVRVDVDNGLLVFKVAKSSPYLSIIGGNLLYAGIGSCLVLVWGVGLFAFS